MQLADDVTSEVLRLKIAHLQHLLECRKRDIAAAKALRDHTVNELELARSVLSSDRQSMVTALEQSMQAPDDQPSTEAFQYAQREATWESEVEAAQERPGGGLGTTSPVGLSADSAAGVDYPSSQTNTASSEVPELSRPESLPLPSAESLTWRQKAASDVLNTLMQKQAQVMTVRVVEQVARLNAEHSRLQQRIWDRFADQARATMWFTHHTPDHFTSTQASTVPMSMGKTNRILMGASCEERMAEPSVLLRIVTFRAAIRAANWITWQELENMDVGSRPDYQHWSFEMSVEREDGSLGWYRVHGCCFHSPRLAEGCVVDLSKIVHLQTQCEQMITWNRRMAGLVFDFCVLLDLPSHRIRETWDTPHIFQGNLAGLNASEVLVDGDFERLTEATMSLSSSECRVQVSLTFVDLTGQTRMRADCTILGDPSGASLCLIGSRFDREMSAKFKTTLSSLPRDAGPGHRSNAGLSALPVSSGDGGLGSQSSVSSIGTATVVVGPMGGVLSRGQSASVAVAARMATFLQQGSGLRPGAPISRRPRDTWTLWTPDLWREWCAMYYRGDRAGDSRVVVARLPGEVRGHEVIAPMFSKFREKYGEIQWIDATHVDPFRVVLICFTSPEAAQRAANRYTLVTRQSDDAVLMLPLSWGLTKGADYVSGFGEVRRVEKRGSGVGVTFADVRHAIRAVLGVVHRQLHRPSRGGGVVAGKSKASSAGRQTHARVQLP